MRRVLVVDDEALIRLTVIDALEEAGFDVVEARTADEALEIIDDMTIHFLFTDIQMPGENSGVDLAVEVARKFPDAGIIVASGRVHPDDISLPPFAEFHGKPFDIDKIVERLKSLAR